MRMVTRCVRMVIFTINVIDRRAVRVVSRVVFVEIGPVDEHGVGPAAPRHQHHGTTNSTKRCSP